MRNNQRFAKRLIGILIIAGMAISSTPVWAVTYDDVKAAENKAAENRNKVSKGEADKDRLSRDIKTADVQLERIQDALSKLEEELAETRGERDKITAKLNTLRVEMAKMQQELKEALQELDHLNGILNERAGNIYKSGEITFLEVLLEARSFSDFVHRAQFLQTIISVDAQLVKDIKTIKRKIEKAKAQLERDQAEVAKQEATLTAEVDRVAALTDAVRAKKNQLRGQIGSKKSLIMRIESDQKRWEAAADAYDRSASQIKAQLSRSTIPTFVSGSPSASGFIWPAAGALTSGFGPRWGRNHNGIDIAVPTGSAVAASKAGRVAIASWYGGYGKLVVIDHGGGVSTWYGHNSSFTTKVGQRVSRGQVIARAGSTGNSTGPHVHFEIRFNGRAFNPRPYLP